jgi:hypothetical protein
LELSGKTGEKRAKAIPKDNFFVKIIKKKFRNPDS